MHLKTNWESSIHLNLREKRSVSAKRKLLIFLKTEVLISLSQADSLLYRRYTEFCLKRFMILPEKYGQ